MNRVEMPLIPKATVADIVLRWFKAACLREALTPAGGTRMKGSSHPKVPPCGRGNGVAKNLRATQRKVNYEQPPVYAKPKRLRREYAKGLRGRALCPCKSGKQWRNCHMRAKAVAA